LVFPLLFTLFLFFFSIVLSHISIGLVLELLFYQPPVQLTLFFSLVDDVVFLFPAHLFLFSSSCLIFFPPCNFCTWLLLLFCSFFFSECLTFCPFFSPYPYLKVQFVIYVYLSFCFWCSPPPKHFGSPHLLLTVVKGCPAFFPSVSHLIFPAPFSLFFPFPFSRSVPSFCFPHIINVVFLRSF